MSKFVTFGLAAATGYAAARALLEHELPQATPTALRAHLEQHRTRLQHAREQAREVLAAARQATDEAASELLADYQRRTGRSTSTGSTSTEPARTSWRR